MKRVRYALISLTTATLMLCLGSGAKADTVDPKIGLGGGGSCASFTESSATEQLTISNFDCTIDFTNAIGSAIGSVMVTVNTPFAGSLSCAIDTQLGEDGSFSQPPFGNAAANGNSCTFSGQFQQIEGPPTGGQVDPGGVYGLRFGYPNLEFLDPNTGAQLDSIDITLSATPVPEPASIILIGTGLATLAFRRKKKQIANLPA